MFIMEIQAHVQRVEQENIVDQVHHHVVVAHQDMEIVQREVIVQEIVIKKYLVETM